MSVELAGYNVVIAASRFNPSVFNLLWLLRNDLIREEDVQPSWLFTEPLVQLNTQAYVLTVMPEQLQYVPLTEATGEDATFNHTKIFENLERIVTRLPHTPYTAIGFNFIWQLVPDKVDVRRMSRELFFNNNSSMFSHFNTDDARFGGYASKDFLGCRLRLDVKPTKNHETEIFQFAFNYNKDLTDSVEPVEEIVAMLGRWHEAGIYASEIVRSIQHNEKSK